MKKFNKPEYDSDLNPVDYYNRYKSDHALGVFKEKAKNVKEISTYVFREGKTAFKFSNNVFICDGKNTCKMEEGKEYTPFMLLSKFKFKGNHYAAYTFVNATFLNYHIPYIRVGVNYFKKIIDTDRFGIDRLEINRWNKESITDDHGKELLKDIPKYDTFTLIPDNKEYSPIINNCYNMYYEFSHKAKEGEWKWTKILLEHIFGDQYELGLKYLQALYLHPKKILPIIVLASKERSTGKSTFLDWMSILFGSNMVVINPTDLSSQFNSSYAMANIVGIEETVTDKSSVIEKLKGLSTTKFLNLNQKFIDNAKLPFFGKFIITTNDEKKFMRVDTEEIRFWVRKLAAPKFKNTNIDMDMVKEIPAFLHHLESLPKLDFSKSRMIFTPEEIRTEWLDNVKKESMSNLYKELRELFISYFEENPIVEVLANPLDIKNKWFQNNNRIEISYIRKVIKEEFNLSTGKMTRYKPFDSINDKSGTPFIFTNEMFNVNDFANNTVEIEGNAPF